MAPPAFRKILVIKLRAIGDTVLMTAPLAELRLAFPEARIDALVSRVSEPILRGHPAIGRIRTYDRTRRFWAYLGGVVRMFRLVRSLRREGYDCVVNLHASPTSAWLAWLSGAPVRAVHFHGHQDANRFSTVTVSGKGQLKPVIERDMDALRALGLDVPKGRQPKVFLSAAEKSSGLATLSRLGLMQPVLVLGLAASRPAKGWPVARFAKLAIRWVTETGGGVLATAGPGEENVVETFFANVHALSQADLRSRIIGRSDLALRELAALVAAASVFCGNDSGPKHIAVAVDTATVTLFGPEHPFEWHPYPVDLHPYVFVEELTCRRDAQPGMPPWCGLDVCTENEHRCMAQIGVDRVFAECRRMALG